MWQRRRTFLLVLPLALTLAGCQSGASEAGSTSTSSTQAATTSTSAEPSTSTTGLVNLSTERFSVPVGPLGVTYETDGAPPGGPSSFAVMADGSVVIADTMALGRGEPRLLHYDRSGDLVAVVDLRNAEVAVIADVVSDGSRLAILDIFLPLNRYRVLYMSRTGDVDTVVELPEGYYLEDGLTGLAWDDTGVLLEFEFGARYARIGEGGTVEPGAVPVFNGFEVEITEGEGRVTNVRIGDSTWTVERSTNLGGGTLIGVSTDGTLVVALDEVDTTGPVLEVVRRVQRYTYNGVLVAEYRFDPGEQYVEVMRPLELGAEGQVIYLAARADHVEIIPEATAAED